MKRIHRILLAVLAVTVSIAIVLGFVSLGTASQGPISTVLQHVASGVSGLESRIVRAFRGPGRRAELTWLAPFREHPDSLRRPDRLLLGAYDDGIPNTLEGLIALERALDVTFPLIQAYTAWGDERSQRFPNRIVEAIHDLGSIPVVTWEPWLATFENRLHPHLPLRDDRDRNGLASVARGDYDFYLQEWARDAAQFGEPLLLRFAHEMNDPYRYPWGPQNNEPEDFIAAWRHVVEVFRTAGATNVVWVWSPHAAYGGYEAYWPGDDYVDWVGTGALNYGTVAYWSEWWTFHEIFGQHYDFLAGFGKPIMLAEFGSLAVGGDRASWYDEALLDLRDRYPTVRAILFFHVQHDATVTRQALDWSLLDEPQVLETLKSALGSEGASTKAESR